MGSLPLLLADIEMIVARRAAPVDVLRRLAGNEAAVLPETLARAGAPSSMQAVDHIGGDAGKLIAWGPGPRASQSLMLAVRARALLDGRLAPSIDDVLDLAEPILKHRMALTFSARAEGRTIPDVIRQLKTRIG